MSPGMRGNRVSSIRMPTFAPYSALPPHASRDPAGILSDPFADRCVCFVQRLADDVDQGRLAGLGGALQGRAQLRRVFYTPASDAISSRDSGVIGAGEIDREIALAVAGFLACLDPSEGGVRDHHHHDRQFVPHDMNDLDLA